MARSSRRAPAPDFEDEDDDVLDIATAVAIAAFQGLVASGADPAEAVKSCWQFPHDFMIARRAWWSAVEQAYGGEE